MALTGEIELLIGSQHDDNLTGSAIANFINGRGGDDNLKGRGANDLLLGGGGDDDLDGGGGADELQGGADDDLLKGAGSNDLLRGEEGDDTMLGGAGDDLLESIDGNDVVQGEGDSDSLVFRLTGSNVDFTVVASFDTGAGELVFDVTTAPASVPETRRISTVEQFQVFDSAGDDNIDLSAISAANLQAAGLLGIDVTCGDGEDTVQGTAGADVIFGGNGKDSLLGNDGDDQLFGEGDDDTLFGGEGNDILDGGPGNNILDGGPGQDGIVFYGTEGNDSVRIRRQVGPSGPQVIFEINGAADVEDYRNGETVFVFAGGGNDQVVMETGAGAFWSAEFHGEAGHDQLAGAQRDDLLDGGDGNDLLFGLAGRDTFIGGPGLDVVFATDGEIDRILAEALDVLLRDAGDQVA